MKIINKSKKQINSGNEKPGTLIEFECGAKIVCLVTQENSWQDLLILHENNEQLNDSSMLYRKSGNYINTKYKQGDYKVIARPNEWNIIIDGDEE
ncbi:MAG: hypothetical protein ACTSXD_08440 [Candidatus Heimdallarchaeaceae archaeon]